MKNKNYLRARCTPVIPERKSLCSFLEPFEVKRKKAKICSQKVFADVSCKVQQRPKNIPCGVIVLREPIRLKEDCRVSSLSLHSPQGLPYLLMISLRL